MAQLDLVDETFIAAPPVAIAAAIADLNLLQQWWPDLSLVVFMDRGITGTRWSVTGAFVGSTEIWIEAFGDGAIVHYYLRVDPTTRDSDTTAEPFPDTLAGRRKAANVLAQRAAAWKRCVWTLKDQLEGDRRPGEAATS